MALRNVCMELLIRSTNGSLTGNLADPHSTECSRIWNTPVESAGGVLKPMAKALFSSSHARYSRRAPEAVWRST